MNIGWIGLGRMGEAMVKRLLAAGHGVQVWNRTRAKALPLADYGAAIAEHKLDLAACDLVFTMVSTTDDLKDVLQSLCEITVLAEKAGTRATCFWKASTTRCWAACTHATSRRC